MNTFVHPSWHKYRGGFKTNSQKWITELKGMWILNFIRYFPQLNREVIPVYTPTISIWECLFVHNLPNTPYYPTFWSILIYCWKKNLSIVLIGSLIKVMALACFHKFKSHLWFVSISFFNFLLFLFFSLSSTHL